MRVAGKICLKAISDTSYVERGTGVLNFLIGDDMKQMGKLQNFGLARKPPSPQFSLLVRHPDLPSRKTPRTVLGLFTVIILKSKSEGIFF